MADDRQKPRSLEDIKARLGRPIPRPSEPEASADSPLPSPISTTPPPPEGLGADLADAGRSRKTPGSPFEPERPAARASSARGPAAPRPAPTDPFAAAEAAPERRVEAAPTHHGPVEDVDHALPRRKSQWILLAVGLVAGLIVGALVVSVNDANKDYNRSVRDGKAIFAAVQASAEPIDHATQLVARIKAAAAGAPGTPPKVDYEAIEALQKIPRPFGAAAFSRRDYRRFNPSTVDSLFAFQRAVDASWADIAELGRVATPGPRREALDKAAAAAGDTESLQTGCVPAIAQDQIRCVLVYVDPPTDAQAKAGKLVVHTQPHGGQSAEKIFYRGQDLHDDPSRYVILTNNEASAAVLGERASAFARFRERADTLAAQLDATSKARGELETDLGSIVTLKEQVAFGD